MRSLTAVWEQFYDTLYKLKLISDSVSNSPLSALAQYLDPIIARVPHRAVVFRSPLLFSTCCSARAEYRANSATRDGDVYEGRARCCSILTVTQHPLIGRRFHRLGSRFTGFNVEVAISCSFDRAVSEGCLCEHRVLTIEDVTGPASAAVGREVIVITIERDIRFLTDPVHDRSS